MLSIAVNTNDILAFLLRKKMPQRINRVAFTLPFLLGNSPHLKLAKVFGQDVLGYIIKVILKDATFKDQKTDSSGHVTDRGGLAQKVM